ncbi:P-loop ATPase, Sll1717 family [Prosthecomicrobium hirschii]|uniref:P-loop ATPase, Sll1717 family n=1 Tax=Prosthecodimorpha hirschii TaxID=665126 RepID=UPI00128F60E0|nr:hypothetical protein [Prosthecomicrobium hirschii]
MSKTYRPTNPISTLRLPYRDATQFMSQSDLQFFKENFVRLNSIEELLNKPSVFIIGDKGSGKSAFATYFSNSMDLSVNGTSLLFEKTDYDSFSNFAKGSGDLRMADYSGIWTSLLLVHLLSFLAHSSSELYRKDDKLQRFKEILNSFGHDQPLARFGASFDLVCWNRESFYSALKERFPPSADRPVGLPQQMPTDFRTYLSSLNGFLARLVKDCPDPDKKYFAFIDGLDVQSFEFSLNSSGNEKLQTICISGLVDAAWKLNRDVLFKKFNHDVRVVVLIRPDIFERVGFHNTGTKLADNAIFLNWNTKARGFEHSEFFKIANRLLEPLVTTTLSDDSPDVGSSSAPNDEEHAVISDCPWNAVFNTMFVTNSKKYRHTFVEFLYNSFSRPRDLVVFLDTVKTTMSDRNIGDQLTVNAKIFRDPILRQKYSEYLKSEVKDAISFYYSNADFDIMEKFFEFLSEELTYFEFSHSDYEKAFARLNQYISDSKAKAAPIYDTPDGFLQFLYEQNIIGAITKGAKSTITLFAMSVRNSSTLRPRVPSADRYRLHGGVARALYPSRIS